MAREETQFARRRQKTGGRSRGTPNKATAEGRAFAQKLVNDPGYLASVEARAKAGKLPPGIESMLWYYAHGKPRETVDINSTVSTRDVDEMDTSELLQELHAHHTATGQFLAQNAAHTQNE